MQTLDRQTDEYGHSEQLEMGSKLATESSPVIEGTNPTPKVGTDQNIRRSSVNWLIHRKDFEVGSISSSQRSAARLRAQEAAIEKQQLEEEIREKEWQLEQNRKKRGLQLELERLRVDEEAEIEELRSKAQLKEDLNRMKSDFLEKTLSRILWPTPTTLILMEIAIWVFEWLVREALP